MSSRFKELLDQLLQEHERQISLKDQHVMSSLMAEQSCMSEEVMSQARRPDPEELRLTAQAELAPQIQHPVMRSEFEVPNTEAGELQSTCSSPLACLPGELETRDTRSLSKPVPSLEMPLQGECRLPSKGQIRPPSKPATWTPSRLPSKEPPWLEVQPPPARPPSKLDTWTPSRSPSLEQHRLEVEPLHNARRRLSELARLQMTDPIDDADSEHSEDAGILVKEASENKLETIKDAHYTESNGQDQFASEGAASKWTEAADTSADEGNDDMNDVSGCLSADVSGGPFKNSFRRVSTMSSIIQIGDAWIAPQSTRSRKTCQTATSYLDRLESASYSCEQPVITRMTVVDRRARRARDGTDLWGDVLSPRNLCEYLVAKPSSGKRLCWDLLGCLFLCYDLIAVPMQFLDPQTDMFFQVINILTCTFWTADIVASFLVGYYATGKVEMRFTYIAKHYIKTWFLLDLGLAAMDWVFFSVGGFNSNARVMRLGKVFRGMRVFRLLRMLKFHVIFEDILDRIHSEYHRTLLGILKLVVFIIVVNHFIACCFYGLHHLRTSDTWVKANFDSNDGLGYRYWTAMHWSMTQFTPASMEVVPKNSLERFYAVCTLLCALVTFSSFVSTITNSMTHLRRLNAAESKMHSQLHRYFSEHGVHEDLVHTILRYVRVQRAELARNRNTSVCEEDVALLKTLPEGLRTELRLEVHLPTARFHPLFYNYDLVDPTAMRHTIRIAMKECVLMMDEQHLSYNDVIRSMIVVRSGELVYSYQMDTGQLANFKITGHQWACEAALWARNPEAFGPLVSKAATSVLLVDATQLYRAARRHDASFHHIQQYARLFVDYLKAELEDNPWAAVLCNNFDSVRDIVQVAFDTASHSCGTPTPRMSKGTSLCRSRSFRTEDKQPSLIRKLSRSATAWRSK